MQNLGSFEGILELPKCQIDEMQFCAIFFLPKMLFCLITHKVSILDHTNILKVNIKVYIPNTLVPIQCLYHAQFSNMTHLYTND